jgi:Protein of unknown function (DUF3631)
MTEDRYLTDDHRDAGELLGEIVDFIRRFVVLTPAQADVLALWVVHTHTIEAADATPYLAITSAEKRSGKTRTLELLAQLVARSWFTGRVTAAVLARKVDAERPTLLLDESDAAFKGDKDYAEALRGILNTGYRRGGSTTVCVGQGANISYKDFPTFCAKAIAGIGKLPDTVADRSIPLRLERRGPGETVERFRLRQVGAETADLYDYIAYVAEQAVGLLAEARPALPDELDDRAQDVAEPLLALADFAGGDWPARARAAIVELCAGRVVDDDSMGIQLLADVREVIGGDDRIATTALLGRLAALDERPWAEWFGKPLTSRALARLLKPYAIHSRSVRMEDGSTPKGFLREQFEPAWGRYLVQKTPQRHNPHEHWENGDSESATSDGLWRIENGRKPASALECGAVADLGATARRECLRCGAEAALGSTLCVGCKRLVVEAMEAA